MSRLKRCVQAATPHLAAVFLVASCAPILGEYDLDDTAAGSTSSGGTAGAGGGGAAGEGGAGGSEDDCGSDEDCNEAAGYGCDYGRCARRCLDEEVCPSLTRCMGDFCTEPLGTPCDDRDDCGYTCLTLDATALPVAGYCTLFCMDTVPCPGGYECIDFNCYQR